MAIDIVDGGKLRALIVGGLMVFDRVKEELSFIRGNLLVLLVTWSIFNFIFSMEFPYFSLYVRELGASPSLIGIIVAIGTLMHILVRIPGSYIADRYGRKQIITTMTFGVAFSYIFFVLAPDWRMILVGLIISNLCLIYLPAMEALEADSIPPNLRGVGFSLMRVIPSVLSIFSPIIAGYLVGRYGLVMGMRIVYTIIVVGALISALIRLLYLEETIDNPERLTINGFIYSYRESLSSIIDAWRRVPRNLKILTLIIMITAVEDPIFMQYAALYARDVIMIPEDIWGYIFTFSILSALLFAWPAGKLVDIYGRKIALITGFLIGIPATYLFITSREVVQLALVLIMFAFMGTVLGPAFQAFITDETPKEFRGRVFGLIGLLNLVGNVPASILGGFLYEVSPPLPFYILLILDSILVVMIYILIKEPGNTADLYKSH